MIISDKFVFKCPLCGYATESNRDYCIKCNFDIKSFMRDQHAQLYYAKNKISEKDFDSAALFLKNLSKNGNSTAMLEFAELYKKGYGSKDKRNRNIVYCYTQAAESGNLTAMIELSKMYGNGLYGLSQSKEKAEKFLVSAYKSHRTIYSDEEWDRLFLEITGYNTDGFNRDGFNIHGYSREGYNIQGFDRDGFNKYGFDKEGFDKQGYNKEGYNRCGFNRDGFDENGFTADGSIYNTSGFDRNGFNKNGFDKEGFDKYGYNIDGYDKDGFDINGSISPLKSGNINLDKSEYVKGVTKLFVCKSQNVIPVIFERFESRNNEDLIFVNNDGVINFYRFPSEYLFSNKDAAFKSISKSNIKQSGLKMVDRILNSYEKLPKAKKSELFLKSENQNERDYFKSVKATILEKINNLKYSVKEKQQEWSEIRDTFRENLRKAHEDGEMIDDHSVISYQMSVEKKLSWYTPIEKELKKLESILKKPYFARIDCGKDFQNLHTAYIGEIDIPGFVIDWRDPNIGNAYYQSHFLKRSQNMVIALKRLINIDNAEYKGFNDEINLYNSELIDKDDELSLSSLTDELLLNLLKESRSDRSSHSIAKTLQSEQYDIVSSDYKQNTVTIGCAGSGKTMIMYHRLSYIAYNYENLSGDIFDPQNVYIVTPSAFFKDLNEGLLHKLQIDDNINHSPFSEQIRNLVHRHAAKYNLSTLFEVFPDVTYSEENFDENFYSDYSYSKFSDYIRKIESDKDIEKKYREWVIFTINSTLSTFTSGIVASDISENNISSVFNEFYNSNCFKKKNSKGYYTKDLILNTSYDNLLAMINNPEYKNNFSSRMNTVNKYLNILKQYLSSEIKFKEYPNNRGNLYINDKSNGILAFLDSTSFEKMLFLMASEDILKSVFICNENDFLLKCYFAFSQTVQHKYDEHKYLYFLRAATEKYGRITDKDCFIFIDEFQNYSEFELSIIKNAFKIPIFNLYGDYDQCLESKGENLRENLDKLLSPNTYHINVNYRNAKQITDYVNKTLYKNIQAIGITGSVTETEFSSCDFTVENRTAIICKNLRTALIALCAYIPEENLNDISQSKNLDEKKFNIVSVMECKGLEFDKVYVIESNMSDNDRYVSYTRALEKLIVIKEHCSQSH